MITRVSLIPRWLWGVSATALVLFGWSLLLLIGVARARDDLAKGIACLRSLESLQEQVWALLTPSEQAEDRPPTEPEWLNRLAGCRAAFDAGQTSARSRAGLAEGFETLAALLDGIEASYLRLPRVGAADLVARRLESREGIDRTLRQAEATLAAVRRGNGVASTRLGRGWDSLGALVMMAAALVGCTAIFSRRDLRRRTVAEERLRASEERYQNIYHNGPLAVIVWDANGRLVEWNRRTAEMFGWTDAVKGMPILDMIPESDREQTTQAIDTLDRDHPPLRRIWKSVAADGKELICEWHSTALHDADGQVTSIIASALDVTDREHAAEALRRSEERYRRLFESNLIGITVSLPDGTLADANDAFLALVGYNRDDFEEGLVRWDEMTPPEYRPFDEHAQRELDATGICMPYEKEYIRKDSSRVPILIGVAPFEPERSSCVCFVLDISPKHEAEAAALASRGLIESIRRAHLDFIAQTDLHVVFGGLLDSLLALTASNYGFIAELLRTPEGRPYLRAAAITNIAWDEASRSHYEGNLRRGMEFHNMNTLFGLVVTTGDPVIANEPVNDPRAGGLPPGHPPLAAFLGLPFYHGPTLMGVIGIANRAGGYSESDIAYLEPLMTTCAGLLAAHRAEVSRSEAEAKLMASKEAAEAANQAKDRFLAVLSHELRTPLTPVLAAVSAAVNDPASSPELRDLCQMIGRNVELEARLIDDLLDVSRIGRGMLRLEPAIIDAHILIREVAAICRDDIETAEVELVLGLDATAHHIEVDPARFQQVLWNLVKNAVKFTPPNGRISVRTHNATITTGNGRSRTAQRLVIEVSDTGSGIEPEDLSRIFVAFEQGESSRRRRAGGLGLGLAISRSVVEGHGGALRASSGGRDHGATFTVELATVPAPAPVIAVSTPPPAASEPRKGLDIVLVEDNKDTLFYLSLLLENAGHRVRTASTLAKAVETTEAGPFDLLLSDIELPDGTGLDLIRHLRASRTERIPAIAMSGFGSDDDVRLSLDAGFLAHLTKPVDFNRLQAEIARTISETIAG
jgi:PAS domain S-box-containing protein